MMWLPTLSHICVCIANSYIIVEVWMAYAI